MPQLDKYTYFSQIIWFLFIISILYFIIINFIIPTLASTFKLRIKLSLKLNNKINLNFTFIKIGEIVLSFYYYKSLIEEINLVLFFILDLIKFNLIYYSIISKNVIKFY